MSFINATEPGITLAQRSAATRSSTTAGSIATRALRRSRSSARWISSPRTQATDGFPTPPPRAPARRASTVADDIDLLHAFVIGVTMLISLFVFADGGLVHRFATTAARPASSRSTSKPRSSSEVPHDRRPCSGCSFFWWVIGFRQYIDLTQAAAEFAARVRRSAKQWMWKFTYADGREANGRPHRPRPSAREA